MQQKEIIKIQNMANAVRFLSIDMITKAKSGHPGLPMGMAEVATVLFSRHLKFSASYPKWENRDRFILSAGHGSALLYSILYLSGYKDITLDDIKNFRQLGSKAAGHPEYGLLDGIETTTGPLGQGIATGVGIALGNKIKEQKLGSDIINNKVYVLVGDGCLMEGISEEAISFAGTLNLNNLIVLWDDNNITIDGQATIANKVDMKARFKANNWDVLEIIDGYDIEEIDNILSKARNCLKPVFIDIHTTIGKGCKELENTSTVHGTPLSPEQVIESKIQIGYPIESFKIPDDIKNDWLNVGNKNIESINEWNKKVEHLDKHKQKILNNLYSIDNTDLSEIFLNIKKKFIDANFSKATRNANTVILEDISDYLQNMIGGSADLSTPTGVKTNKTISITANNFDGNFVNYGIREHLMGAVLNGLSLSGFKAFGSTFLTFSDYLKPALRLSTLMKLSPIYIFSHDSIFVGEDGPTHQPVEHLAAIRSIPNVNVIRPADAIETLEAWEIALYAKSKPTVIILSRQAAPIIRNDLNIENKVQRGAYIVSDKKEAKNHNMIIIATGTEVNLSINIQKILLEKYNINASVVSMPSIYLFELQDEKYKKDIIPETVTTVSIEASSTFGWSKYAKINIGIDEFGTSAPGNDVAEYMNFKAEKIIEKILLEIK